MPAIVLTNDVIGSQLCTFKVDMLVDRAGLSRSAANTQGFTQLLVMPNDLPEQQQWDTAARLPLGMNILGFGWDVGTLCNTTPFSNLA